MWGTYGDTSQDVIQKWFVVAAMLCIPLMLIPKPLYEIYCNSSAHHSKKEDDNQYSNRLLDSSENLEGSDRSSAGSKVHKANDHGSD